MAKDRKTNTIQSAITSLTAALRLESIPNPTAEQKEQIYQAKIEAADILDDSNLVTVAENVDDDIEQQHQRAEEAAQNDIDPPEPADNDPELAPL